jgi:hypothetical protein
MKKIFLVILFFYSLSCTSQVFTGKLIDAESKEAAEYVNVGIIGKNVGTVSDDKGVFSLELNNQFDKDTLKFSMIGFESQQFEVGKFKQKYQNNKEITIQLNRSNTTLEEIVVRPKTFVVKTLGNTAHSSTLIAGIKENNLGYELGTVMKIRKAPAYIENINFNISVNKYDSVTFRVNIYKMKGGKPAESILTEPIFITTTMKTGTLTIDMKKYNLEVEDDFLVSLEWIKKLDGNGLYFCAGLFNANSYKMATSQGDWYKIDKIGLGFYTTVLYEK